MTEKLTKTPPGVSRTLDLTPIDDPTVTRDEMVRTPAKHQAVFAAACDILKLYETGVKVTSPTLLNILKQRTGAGAAAGAWTWKEASDAAEAAMNILLLKYGRVMQIATMPDVAADRLAMLAALEPPASGRDDEQIRMQAFSTPIELAQAVVEAARIQPWDRVLEPSAGTGTLACLASLRLNVQEGGRLYVNELSARRRTLLSGVLKGLGTTVKGENAEHIAEFMPQRATAIVMNPPFSRRAQHAHRDNDADVVHIAAAYRALEQGGRLSVLTSESCEPHDPAWERMFSGRTTAPALLYTAPVEGRAYRRRGTNATTRLTVIERPLDENAAAPAATIIERELSTRELLNSVCESLPARQALKAAGPVEVIRPAKTDAPIRRRKARERLHLVPELGPMTEVKASGRIIAAERDDDDSETFVPWSASFTIDRGTPHPTTLVESVSMASVPHPDLTENALVPQAAIDKNALSDAQLESVLLATTSHAGQLGGVYRITSDWETIVRVDADTEEKYHSFTGSPNERGHETMAWLNEQATSGLNITDSTEVGKSWSTPVTIRRGWMLGDGTGAGKGRQVAAVIADQMLRGSQRALWISQSAVLIEDARRDWIAIGGHPDDIFPAKETSANEQIARRGGILFMTYAALRVQGQQGRRARLDQIVEWLAGSLAEEKRFDADPVIVFDEAHAMANAAARKGGRGVLGPSLQGVTAMKLQNALPQARVMYVSATGASSIHGLSYAARLGLWQSDLVPFESREKFVEAMEKGGIAALELMARDLKALGLYQSRILSYAGVQIEMIVHKVTPEQRKLWNQWADAFGIIHENLEAALEATNIVFAGKTIAKQAKSTAVSRFESLKQRFFNHMLCSLPMATIIGLIDKALENNEAAIIQLVSTGEALTTRRLATVPVSDWNDVQIDTTPREYVLEYLEAAFPVTLMEEYEREDGATMARPVLDSDGRPVQSQEAVNMRETLIAQLATAPALPGALDILVQHYGVDDIAEISGRSRRIVPGPIQEGGKLRIETRSQTANIAETLAFQNGEKRILVFSRAGNTGVSYHDEIGGGNRRRRRHFMIETGWEAAQVVQGLGRSHRAHQATEPVFCPVSTDIKGQRRFMATAARRIAALGAITRAQRDSQSKMDAEGRALFREEDNFESDYAKAALRDFHRTVAADKIDKWPYERYQAATGLVLVDADGVLKTDLPPMARTLNRILALRIEDQNEIFSEIERRIAQKIDEAKQNGTYDVGIEEVRARSIRIIERKQLADSGTELVVIDTIRNIRTKSLKDARREIAGLERERRNARLMINEQSGQAAVASDGVTMMNRRGEPERSTHLYRPKENELLEGWRWHVSKWREAAEPEWEAAWAAEIEEAAAGRKETWNLACGTLLPIWHKLPSWLTRVYRCVADDGTRLIGRFIPAEEVENFVSAVSGEPKIQKSAARRQPYFHQVQTSGTRVKLADSMTIGRRRVMNEERVTIANARYEDLETLKRLGCTAERIRFEMIVTVPNERVYTRILTHYAGA